MRSRFVLAGSLFAVSLGLVSVLFLTGCEGSGGDGGSSTPANVAGSWQGTYTAPGEAPSPDSLDLTQDGSSVSGSLDGTPVSGTVDGNEVNVSGATVQGGVAWTKRLEATVNGDTMTGTETWGLGDPGQEPVWLSPMAVSLTRAGN